MTKSNLTNIKLRYNSVDGVSKTRIFRTLKGARKFAHEWVGEKADIGSSYAVSWDGVGEITVLAGCTLRDLWPKEE